MIIIIIFFPINFFFLRMIIIQTEISWIKFSNYYLKNMDTQTYNCKKCGLTIASTCSKCDRVVDVKVMDDGCLVQVTKCGDCANVPVIKDICTVQNQ